MAACRFLQRAPNLQRFSYRTLSPFAHKESAVVCAIGDGSTGARLRGFRLPRLEPPLVETLLGHLQASRLPRHRELHLTRYGAEHDMGLAPALEARARLGLPPLTCVAGLVDVQDPAVPPRVWACCPPDAVTHLEARAGGALGALAEHLLERV